MRTVFDRQLKEIHSALAEMGTLCMDAISDCFRYLTEGGERIREAVMDAERQIDEKEREIESLCMKLLLRQQPVARDLRFISAALKMISDMERIGDQAADIVEIAEYVEKTDEIATTRIAEMAKETTWMVSGSIAAFIKRDAMQAEAAISRDDKVDTLFIEVKKELIRRVQAEGGNGEALLDLLMIAKYFERIGDHAENIAERVIYALTGKNKA